MDRLKLLVDNRDVFGWKDISVRKTLEELCGGFSITLRYAETEAVASIQPWKKCTVIISNDETKKEETILTGYIDARPRKIAPTTTSLKVTGRDLTMDIVDCSAIVKSNTFLQSTLYQITNALCKEFDIFVVDEVKNNHIFDKVTIQSGETSFAVIDRLCRQLGVLPLTNNLGQIVLANTGRKAEKAGVDLVYKGNVQDVEEFFDVSERYSDYTVKGQGSTSGQPWLKNNATALNAKSKDEQVPRYRPLVIMSESKATGATMKTRANWEAQVRSGKSKYYQVVVDNWKKSKDVDEVWKRNTLVNLIVDEWGINEEFLITSTEQTENDKGDATILTLKNPDIYGANATGGLKV